MNSIPRVHIKLRKTNSKAAPDLHIHTHICNLFTAQPAYRCLHSQYPGGRNKRVKLEA